MRINRKRLEEAVAELGRVGETPDGGLRRGERFRKGRYPRHTRAGARGVAWVQSPSE